MSVRCCDESFVLHRASAANYLNNYCIVLRGSVPDKRVPDGRHLLLLVQKQVVSFDDISKPEFSSPFSVLRKAETSGVVK